MDRRLNVVNEATCSNALKQRAAQTLRVSSTEGEQRLQRGAFDTACLQQQIKQKREVREAGEKAGKEYRAVLIHREGLFQEQERQRSENRAAIEKENTRHLDLQKHQKQKSSQKVELEDSLADDVNRNIERNQLFNRIADRGKKGHWNAVKEQVRCHRLRQALQTAEQAAHHAAMVKLNADCCELEYQVSQQKRKQLSEHKQAVEAQRKQNQLIKELEKAKVAEQEDMHERTLLQSTLLCEDRDQSLWHGNPSRVRVDHYKGMSECQKARLDKQEQARKTFQAALQEEEQRLRAEEEMQRIAMLQAWEKRDSDSEKEKNRARQMYAKTLSDQVARKHQRLASVQSTSKDAP